MPNQGGGSPHDLLVQSWVMYSISILFFAVRLYARYKRLGFRYQIEDYLMVVAVCFYTVFVVTNIKLSQGGGGSLYRPDQFETFTHDDILERIKGSKIEFASENCQLCTIYTLKASMLVVYLRLTANVRQNQFVKICAGYTLVGWLATELTLFLNCHPLSGYWTLPPPQRECATYFRYEVVQCVFNISSDMAILFTILPMLWRTRMPWRTKLPVLTVFSMGIFVILCAAVSKYFTFNNIYDTSYQFWYLREASIGIYVTNAPFIWGLASSMFSFLKVSNPANDSPQYGTNRVSKSRSKGTETGSSTRALARIYDFDAIAESEEHIIEMDGVGNRARVSAAPTGESDPAGPASHWDDRHIWKTTEVSVEEDQST